MRTKALKVILAITAGSFLVACTKSRGNIEKSIKKAQKKGITSAGNWNKVDIAKNKPSKIIPAIYIPRKRGPGCNQKIAEKLCIRIIISYQALKKQGFKSSLQAEFLLGEVLVNAFTSTQVFGQALEQLTIEINRAIKFLESKKELKDGYSKEGLLQVFEKAKNILEKKTQNPRNTCFNCRSRPFGYPVLQFTTGWPSVDGKVVHGILKQFHLNRNGLNLEEYLPSNILAAKLPSGATNLAIVYLVEHDSSRGQASLFKLFRSLTRDRGVITYGVEANPDEIQDSLDASYSKKQEIQDMINKYYRSRGGSFYTLVEAIRKKKMTDPKAHHPIFGFQIGAFNPIFAHHLMKDKLRIYGIENPDHRRDFIEAAGGFPKVKTRRQMTNLSVRYLRIAEKRGRAMALNMVKNLNKSKRRLPVGIMATVPRHAREVRYVLENDPRAAKTAFLMLYSQDFLPFVLEYLMMPKEWI
jgi:hypothetical protein